VDGLSIIGVAIGVGVVVYALSLRTPDRAIDADALPPAPGAGRSPLAWLRERTAKPTGEELGFGAEAVPGGATSEPEPESFVYVPVLAAGGPRWTTRLGGVVGLIAAVVIAAAALAIGIYQLGHLLNQMVQGFLGN
jgi:hypothetical protein